ncbi:MAG: ATP-dependent DNA helicase RecG [Candidatus Obscuribacterales bacterium]|nr:ATP-dependent DNA helicase RecG [Candidatus Obscuribacterales bacterium]
MPVVQGKYKEVELNALRRAILVERKGRYADYQGKRSTFSQFMRQTAAVMCRRNPKEARWATILGLFREYPNLDVATRIAVLRRAEELIETLMGSPSAEDPVAESQPEKPAASKESNKPATLPRKAVEQKSVPPVKPITINKDAKATKTNKLPREVDVQYVKGVGPKVAELLNRLNIFTAHDLIHHYPKRHLDFQNRLMIKDVEPGQEVTVFGTIASVSAFQSRRGNVSILTVVITDGTGRLNVTRFIGGKSNKYLLDRYKAQYPKGAQVMASGIVERDKSGRRLELKNAELEIFGNLAGDGEELDSIHAGRLVPVYPLTEGLSLRYLRNVIHNALESFLANVDETLPAEIIKKYDLVDLKSALKEIHFPESHEALNLARRRLVFDELFGMQLQLAWRRHHYQVSESAVELVMKPEGLVARLRASLPFTLTNAQERVFKEIASDMASGKPMQRLVQGDVGSGKTVVALMALLVAVENGYQGAIMAPTEILAEQHFRQFQRLLTPLGLKAALLLGKQGVKERREVHQGLMSGQIHIAVGTHALIQEGVEFEKLGLIIIDEQHRFGVKQRAQLKAKGVHPQLLTMTATPIPRTLALCLHGDLDVSEIDELPPGRKPIETKLLTGTEKRQVWAGVERQVQAGRQAYVVFPLIEESETLSAKAATAEYEKLKTNVFAHRRVGLMHGKLKPQEKDEVMEQFRRGELDILVSTTVIEVGVDVPNATVMVIENADRFGLAQLHQLRGRVGRGAEQSYCLLLSDSRTDTTRQRLEIMTKTNDGFVVAEKDLEIRGPGEFLGTRQSGLPDLLLADLLNDAEILELARKAAVEMINADPELVKHPMLKQRVNKTLALEQTQYLGSG